MVQLPIETGGDSELLVSNNGTQSKYSMTTSYDVRFHAATWLTDVDLEARAMNCHCVYLRYAVVASESGPIPSVREAGSVSWLLR